MDNLYASGKKYHVIIVLCFGDSLSFVVSLSPLCSLEENEACYNLAYGVTSPCWPIFVQAIIVWCGFHLNFKSSSIIDGSFLCLSKGAFNHFSPKRLYGPWFNLCHVWHIPYISVSLKYYHFWWGKGIISLWSTSSFKPRL